MLCCKHTWAQPVPCYTEISLISRIQYTRYDACSALFLLELQSQPIDGDTELTALLPVRKGVTGYGMATERHANVNVFGPSSNFLRSLGGLRWAAADLRTTVLSLHIWL